MKHRIAFWNLAARITLLSQTTVGILVNFFLMFYYLVLYYRKCRLKPTDFILLHLLAANSLFILSSGVPHIIGLWGLKQFLNDIVCELLFYIQGFGRSVSIWTTCLLSVFQAMTISPRKSCWKDHKVKAVKHISSSISLMWILHMLIHFFILVYPFIKMNSKNVTKLQDFGYCSIVKKENITEFLYAAFVMFPEFFFSVLIAWSSGSMIVILFKHKQRVLHIHSTHVSRRNSPESRATQNILALVSTFLAFYTLSSILRGYIILLYNYNWWLMNINHIISLCFPSFGPCVFIKSYSLMSRCNLAHLRKNNNKPIS
ncbi:vomeronasal 1 receptor, 184 [Mus musculus]|uniref:Vomeronasal type-1 receptor n=1 Tax=Mus musculus TaxID=10090 RepID=E9Q2N4_MOUSE|nr:vomeronasal 1 receptor, 184 [Mus musculus]|eukprot:NP_001161012.1 vomeronasal 1 receptor, 184 [Mus musculus]